MIVKDLMYYIIDNNIGSETPIVVKSVDGDELFLTVDELEVSEEGELVIGLATASDETATEEAPASDEGPQDQT